VGNAYPTTRIKSFTLNEKLLVLSLHVQCNRGFKLLLKGYMYNGKSMEQLSLAILATDWIWEILPLNLTREAIRNTETPSRNHYYRGKAISITYAECVSVALVIQHEKACAVLYCYLRPIRL
jgi:hypothetical protein